MNYIILFYLILCIQLSIEIVNGISMKSTQLSLDRSHAINVDSKHYNDAIQQSILRNILTIKGGKTESMFSLRYWTKKFGALFKKYFGKSNSKVDLNKKDKSRDTKGETLKSDSSKTTKQSSNGSKSTVGSTANSRLQKVGHLKLSI